MCLHLLRVRGGLHVRMVDDRQHIQREIEMALTETLISSGLGIPMKDGLTSLCLSEWRPLSLPLQIFVRIVGQMWSGACLMNEGEDEQREEIIWIHYGVVLVEGLVFLGHSKMHKRCLRAHVSYRTTRLKARDLHIRCSYQESGQTFEVKTSIHTGIWKCQVLIASCQRCVTRLGGINGTTCQDEHKTRGDAKNK